MYMQKLLVLSKNFPTNFKKCDASHALNLAIFQNVAKIPEELLASAAIWEFEKSAEKESPALSMIEQMFKKGQAHDMFSRIFSTKCKYYVIPI